MGGGPLRELSPYCVKILPHLHVVSNCREFPHSTTCEKATLRKIWYFPLRNFLIFLILLRNVIMSQHFIIHCLLYYLSSSCLWEVKNKGKFQTFSPISDRNHL